MISYRSIFFVAAIVFTSFSYADDTMFLRENLQRAQPGDFLVISAGKNDTLMHIYERQNNSITVEEISIPDRIRSNQQTNWKEWVQNNAPGNNSWVMYDINLISGQMTRYYSYTKGGWYEIPDADNFISKLLNLRLFKIPEKERKKIGHKRYVWNPKVTVEGKVVYDVPFDAWKATWPNDGSDLSGKLIEIYLPQNSNLYPSYFPYWLQISGTIGKAKVRIIDSGSGLVSNEPSLNSIK